MALYNTETSSNLIMQVIRFSQDDANRDVIRNNLDEHLKNSDKNLTMLASKHHQDLRTIMQKFTKTANNLETSMSKLKQAKQRLEDSREQLTSKMDELERLSEELRISEKIVDLLDQRYPPVVEENQIQPEKAADELHDKEYEPTYMENNVFNPRTNEDSTTSLFKFSRSSYAICFEEHFKELSI